MATNLLLCVIASTIVTAIVNFAKIWYKGIKKEVKDAINVLLSFWLGIVASYAIYPRISLELTTGAIILIWLGIGTGSQIRYSVLEILKWWGSKVKWLNLD